MQAVLRHAARPRPHRRSAARAPRWQSDEVMAISDDSDSSDYSPDEDELQEALERQQEDNLDQEVMWFGPHGIDPHGRTIPHGSLS